jgi:hypothetical protein
MLSLNRSGTIMVLHAGIRPGRLSGRDSSLSGDGQRHLRRAPGAPPDNSLFRRNHCLFRGEYSVFGEEQGFTGKPLKQRHNLTSSIAKNRQNEPKFSQYPVKFPVRREFAAPGGRC